MHAGLKGHNKEQKKNSLTIKQTVYYVKNTNISYNYWHFVMATCFGLCLEYLQDNVLK